jgi:hypothetical protein
LSVLEARSLSPVFDGRSGDDDPRGNAVWKGVMSWACPRCHRAFRQVNQRHACGVGSTETLLKGRPAALAELYRTLEAAVGRFGEVEVVTRDRYALKWQTGLPRRPCPDRRGPAHDHAVLA